MTVHLQFRRYAGCPICNLHLRSFATRNADIERAGVKEVVVFHSPVAAMAPYQGSLPFDAVADPEKKLYKRFGVEASLRSLLSFRALLDALKGMASTKPARTREGGAIGLPAEFLIGSDGRILAAHYGRHAADHWSPDEMLALVAAPGPAAVPAMAG